MIQLRVLFHVQEYQETPQPGSKHFQANISIRFSNVATTFENLLFLTSLYQRALMLHTVESL